MYMGGIKPLPNPYLKPLSRST